MSGQTYCTRCGERLLAGDQFCPACGERARKPSASQDLRTPRRVQSPQAIQAQHKKAEKEQAIAALKRDWWKNALAVIVIVLVLYSWLG